MYPSTSWNQNGFSQTCDHRYRCGAEPRREAVSLLVLCAEPRPVAGPVDPGVPGGTGCRVRLPRLAQRPRRRVPRRRHRAAVLVDAPVRPVQVAAFGRRPVRVSPRPQLGVGVGQHKLRLLDSEPLAELLGDLVGGGREAHEQAAVNGVECECSRLRAAIPLLGIPRRAPAAVLDHVVQDSAHAVIRRGNRCVPHGAKSADSGGLGVRNFDHDGFSPERAAGTGNAGTQQNGQNRPCTHQHVLLSWIGYAP